MRYLAILAVLLALVLMPTVASAETFEWDPGPPKGVVGHDGIACYGEASQGGHTAKLTNYVGADAGWMSSQPDRERAWQQAECRSMMESHLALVFTWKWNVDLDLANVRVSSRRL
jgi:hypothetical protein